MPKVIPPITCVSIVICDDVFHDKVTNKMALWGTFNSISAVSAPVIHPRMNVFLAVTNGRGTKNVSVSIVNAKKNAPIIEIAGPMQFSGPLEVYDLNLSLLGVPFPEFGKYWVEVKDDGRIVGQRPFFVNKIPGAKNKRGKRNASN
jgi:hypothetical protein